jgi:8-oxo-dGTP diphosphatase
MDKLQEIKDFIEKGNQEYRPNLTVDCAIFGYHQGELALLLLKNEMFLKWCLPGTYVKYNENLEQAAARVTDERCGIPNLFLKQFKTFGDPARNHNETFDEKKFFELTGTSLNADNWLLGITVSVGFYAISNIVKTIPKVDYFSSECRWFSVNKLPQLGFDHSEIVAEALVVMRMHLYHYPIGKNLLPARFTLKEIKLFYEVMSGKSLHISNFPSKLNSMGLIVKTTKKKSIGAHRSPTYYRFNDKAYAKALKQGLVLV